MRKPLILLTFATALGLIGTAGCCCSLCHHRPSCPPSCPPGCPPGPMALPPVGPGPAPIAFPPGPAAPVAPVTPVPPAPAPPEVRSFGPSTNQDSLYGWRGGQSDVRLSPPVAGIPPTDGKSETSAADTAPPAKMPSGPPAAVLPVGIPQFAPVKDKVANGLRPTLDDGLDWLRSNGYRTVLHLRRPGEDDTADRQQVEKRGMTYVALEVSPQTLTRKTVEDFNHLVSDAAGYPLFVYDRDGSLAGALWYLQFRLVERDPDETARVRAANLGLREDREGNHRAMWLAVQKLLSE